MQRALRVRTAFAISPSQCTVSFATARSLPPCFRRTYADDASTTKQSLSFEGYYADLLDAPLHAVQPATRTAPVIRPIDEPPKTEREEQIAKARAVFGSRTAGPGERKRALEAASRNVAGVMVPPRPEEPENCCMSGCVNCVWDQYRDDMEEWAAKSAEARVKMKEQHAQEQSTGMLAQKDGIPNNAAVSMDDDGGGSESNWSADDADPFANIPVGIREFMKTEKKLKEKRRQESSVLPQEIDDKPITGHQLGPFVK